MNFYKRIDKLRYFCVISHDTVLFTFTYLPSRLGPAPPHAARWAFVLLYALSLCRGYLHTFPMVPPLTDITANPKFIRVVVSAAAPTEGLTVLIIFLLITFVCELWVAFNYPIT